MARLLLSLLGPFQVTLAGEPVISFESDKVRALLAYLAVEARRPHHREILAGLLWPDWPDRAARTNLRNSLANLRQAIGDHQATPPFLLITRETIQFNSASDYRLDVATFVALMEADQVGQPASRRLEEAIALYQGSFLEGFSLKDSPAFEDWSLLTRERLQRQVLTALHQLAGYYEQRGEYERACEVAWRQVELEPWQEEAHQHLMRLLALSGQRSAALAQYETCRRLLADELGVEPAAETTRLYEQIRDGELKAPVPFGPPALAVQPPPYKGLQYFDQADADLFFGRELLTAKLVAHLAPTRRDRFLAVVGASGSGKSSIVRAGLIPALQRGEPLADGTLPPAGCAEWPVHVITPTTHPLEALAVSLTRDSESVKVTTTLMDDLACDPRSLHLYVRRMLSLSPFSASGEGRGGGRLLLVVDQFEELFTLCRGEAERQAFVDNLMTAVETDGSTIVVIALRADFYAHCGQFAFLREALEKRQVYIGPMSVEELRRAVTGPAEQGGWSFEPGLVEFLLQEVGDEPGALPLLSHALLETWQRRQGRTLTFSGYSESGGVRGAIARTAERVLQGLEPEQQASARNIFLRLTELGEGTQDTRRRAKLTELVPRPEDAPAVEAVLQTLASARLITMDEDTAEVAHEVLIREWPTLRSWLDENRAELQLHRHLTGAAQAWAGLGRDPGELYRGARLAQASEWAEAHAGELNPLEREFLGASRELARCQEAEREAQRQRELEAAQKLAETERRRAEEQAQAAGRLRQRALFLTGALLIAGILAVVAVVLGRQATQEREAAERQARLATSRELAAAALNNLEVDPERSVLLALEAVSVTYTGDKTVTREAEEALHRVVPASRVRLTLSNRTGPVYFVAFSPDGTRLATTGRDGTAKVWDAISGEELLTLAGHSDEVWGLDFSPDGARLATASYDGTAKVWDISTAPVLSEAEGLNAGATSGRELLTLAGHDGGAIAVHFSPDGARLVTNGLYDGTVKVWDISTPLNAGATSGEELLTFVAHRAPMWYVALSPDGTRLATASVDGTAKVWDISTALNAGAASGKELLTLSGQAGLVSRVAFSPDGMRLATAHENGTAKIWDISTAPVLSEAEGLNAGATSGEELLTLSGHATLVLWVCFSPDGTRLATGSVDGTAKVWDISTAPVLSQSPERSEGAAEGLNAGAASGEELLTLSGHVGAVMGLAFSPDGMRLATGSYDGTAKVWDLSPDRELLTLAGHTDKVYSLAFSPDGTHLVTGSFDGTAKIWDAASGQALLTLPEGDPTTQIRAVAFSPDGKRLVTTSADGTATVWDSASGRKLFALVGHAAGQTDGEATVNGVTGVAFSPDGTRLATASDDGTAKIWDISTPLNAGATTGQELLTLVGHAPAPASLPSHNGVVEVAFSPDGTRLATAGADGTTRLWDTRSGQEMLTLASHTGSIVVDVDFSPDGSRLVTGGFDGTAKVWDISTPLNAGAATGQELLTLIGHTSAVYGVAFSPDGTRLATGSEDGTAKMWDAITGLELLTLSGHTRGILDIAFSPDGKHLATSSQDGTVRLYVLPIEELVALAQSRVTRSLTDEECRQYLHLKQCPPTP